MRHSAAQPASYPRHRAFLILAWLLGVTSGCRQEPTLPPELAQTTTKPVLDLQHNAALSASEKILVPNLVLSLRADPKSGKTILTLRSRAPHGQAALYLSGVEESADTSPSGPRRFLLTGPGSSWIGPTAGIRTDRWRYQVDTAHILLDSLADDEAKGQIDGAFYRFHRRNPMRERPAAETIRGAFSARRVEDAGP